MRKLIWLKVKGMFWQLLKNIELRICYHALYPCGRTIADSNGGEEKLYKCLKCGLIIGE